MDSQQDGRVCGRHGECCEQDDAGGGPAQDADQGSRAFLLVRNRKTAALRDVDAFDDNVGARLVAAVSLEHGDRVDDVHPVGDAPEHRVLAVEP